MTRVINPLAITDAVLTSSSVAEPDTGAGETAFDIAHTYASGDQAIDATAHRTYQSLVGGNVGNALPNYAAGELQNASWLDIGPTNRWAMFDMVRDTQTVAALPIEVTLTPGMRVNSIALLDLEGDSVTITGTSAGVTVYGPVTISLRTRDVATWYDYFFKPFVANASAVLFDLPPFSDLVLDISVARATGDPKIGTLALGSYTFIGTMKQGATRDTQNFSTIEYDTFGNSTLIARPSAAVLSFTTLADPALTNTIVKLNQDLNAKPAIWCGVDDTGNTFAQAMTICGVYTGFVLTAVGIKTLQVDLKVQEI